MHYKEPDIVRAIKGKKMQWTGQVQIMSKESRVKTCFNQHQELNKEPRKDIHGLLEDLKKIGVSKCETEE